MFLAMPITGLLLSIYILAFTLYVVYSIEKLSEDLKSTSKLVQELVEAVDLKVGNDNQGISEDLITPPSTPTSTPRISIVNVN